MNTFTRLAAVGALALGLTATGAATASADTVDTIDVDAAVSVGADVTADIVADVVIDLDDICIRVGNLIVIGCHDWPEPR